MVSFTSIAIVIASSLILPAIATTSVEFYPSQDCAGTSNPPTYTCDGECHGLDTASFASFKSIIPINQTGPAKGEVAVIDFFSDYKCRGDYNFRKTRDADHCYLVRAEYKPRRSNSNLYFRCTLALGLVVLEDPRITCIVESSLDDPTYLQHKKHLSRIWKRGGTTRDIVWFPTG